jgi:hypothetical protein
VLAMRVLIMVFLPRSLFGWLRKGSSTDLNGISKGNSRIPEVNR